MWVHLCTTLIYVPTLVLGAWKGHVIIGYWLNTVANNQTFGYSRVSRYYGFCFHKMQKNQSQGLPKTTPRPGPSLQGFLLFCTYNYIVLIIRIDNHVINEQVLLINDIEL